MMYAIVAVIALILDQAVKYWTTVNIAVDSGSAKLIPGVIHLANVHNTGAAFSFLEGARWLFVVLCILFVAIVVYVLVKDIIRQPLARWMAVLVSAGAIGNCIDRIVCGYVVDMFEFDFKIFNRAFPVFNVADIFITLGAIIFCVCILLEKTEPGAQPRKSAKAPRAAAKSAAADTDNAPAARKPLVRQRTKLQIPEFPKRAQAEAPAMDPNDPFAEWERRAAETASAPAAPANNVVYTQPAAPAAPAATAYTQPTAPAAPAAPAHTQPAAPAAPAAPAYTQPTAPAAPAAPAHTQPAAPAAPAAPAHTQPAAPAASYNLDDILAEFRDL